MNEEPDVSELVEAMDRLRRNYQLSLPFHQPHSQQLDEEKTDSEGLMESTRRPQKSAGF